MVDMRLKTKNKTHSVSLAFWFFTIAVLILAMLTPMFMRGMTTDGVLYAVMAKNMAHGIGSLWDPRNNSLFWSQHFYEHPPLSLWLESGYFSLFGDGWLTERLFCLTEAILTAIAVVLLWRRVFNQRNLRHLMWLPIFLCFTNFLIIKDVPRNFLDTTVMCFSLWASLAIMRSPVALIKNRTIALALGSLLMIMGFLSNGLQAFFPFMIPLIAVITKCENSWPKACYELFFMLLVSTLLFVILFTLQPAALHNISEYFMTQVVPSTIGSRFTSGGHYVGLARFHIMIYPFFECAVAIVMFLAVYFINPPLDDGYDSKTVNRYSLYFLLIALTASLPVVAAHRQVASYILQSMPFYSLAIAVWLTPRVDAICNKIASSSKYLNNILITSASLCLLVSFAVFIFLFGSFRRGHQIWVDIYHIHRYVGADVKVTVSKEMGYGLSDVLMREYNIDFTRESSSPWYVALCSEPKKSPYELVTVNNKQLCLYRLKQ
jgi:hypothetical protein